MCYVYSLRKLTQASSAKALFEKSKLSIIEVIDFGRAIDKATYNDNHEFKVVVKSKGIKCVEMLSNKPWTYQVMYLLYLSPFIILFPYISLLYILLFYSHYLYLPLSYFPLQKLR